MRYIAYLTIKDESGELVAEYRLKLPKVIGENDVPRRATKPAPPPAKPPVRPEGKHTKYRKYLDEPKPEAVTVSAARGERLLTVKEYGRVKAFVLGDLTPLAIATEMNVPLQQVNYAILSRNYEKYLESANRV